MVVNRLEAVVGGVFRQIGKLLSSAGVKDPGMSNATSAETVPSLLEGAIRLPDIQTVGMSNAKMESLVDATKGLNLGTWGRDILKRAPVTSEEHQTMSLVVMDARTMGVSGDCPTTKQVWERAEKFGDRITAEGMLKIAIEAAKGNIQVEIGEPLVGIMELVSDSLGSPRVLYVERRRDGLFLRAVCASPGGWPPDCLFVVSPRKLISS